MVESEFGAMSACIGASAAGVRTYTATSSQGLLFMAEALFNASGLGLPIVMTVANRAIGAPINIWNDHSDAMSMRDSGWIQLYAESNQEAVDLHVQAFRLAESLSVPVMVCMDGFVLTHAFEEVDLPSQEQVDAFLPPLLPQQQLDPDDPVTIGAMVGPEAFAEVKYLMHAKQVAALDEIPRHRRGVRRRLRPGLRRARQALPDSPAPRPSSSPSAPCSAPSRTSSTRCATRGSRSAPSASPASGRGPPTRSAPRCAAPSGSSSSRRRSRSAPAASSGRTPATPPASLPVTVYDVVAGLGGRPITRASLRGLFDDVIAGHLDPGRLHFLDLDHGARRPRAGPVAPRSPARAARRAMLRDVGTVASGAYE